MGLSSKYIFKKETIVVDQNQVLSDFENNFKRTDCHHKIHRDDSKLELCNEFLDNNYLYKLTAPWNLWYGIGKMSITISPSESGKSQLIQFSISIRRSLLSFALLNIVLGIILFFAFSISLLYIFLLFNVFSIVEYFERFIRHKIFFNRTIRIGDFYKYQVLESKSYDWELILKNKTNTEIVEIIQGKTHLPDIVIELAKKELMTRNDRN